MTVPPGLRELVPVRLPMEGGSHEAVIVLERDGDLQGLGEAPVVPGRGGPLQQILAELASREPRSPAALCALETARLDLEARRRGKPLAALLGGARRRSVESCALVLAGPPYLVGREVERRAAAGFRCFKLKSCDGGRQLDQERLGAARWGAGPDASLRLDFNAGLDAEAAVRLSALRPFRLQLVEQPLPAQARPDRWLRLREATGSPLAADESLADPLLAARLADAGVALAIKIATVGGPLAAHRLASRATAAATVGSTFETSIGIAAALHVACALEAEPLPCGLDSGRLLDDDLAFGAGLRGPRLELPGGPGLGVELDRRALELYRLDR